MLVILFFMCSIYSWREEHHIQDFFITTHLPNKWRRKRRREGSTFTLNNATLGTVLQEGSTHPQEEAIWDVTCLHLGHASPPAFLLPAFCSSCTGFFFFCLSPPLDTGPLTPSPSFSLSSSSHFFKKVTSSSLYALWIPRYTPCAYSIWLCACFVAHHAAAVAGSSPIYICCNYPGSWIHHRLPHAPPLQLTPAVITWPLAITQDTQLVRHRRIPGRYYARCAPLPDPDGRTPPPLTGQRTAHTRHAHARATRDAQHAYAALGSPPPSVLVACNNLLRAATYLLCTRLPFAHMPYWPDTTPWQDATAPRGGPSPSSLF